MWDSGVQCSWCELSAGWHVFGLDLGGVYGVRACVVVVGGLVGIAVIRVIERAVGVFW